MGQLCSRNNAFGEILYPYQEKLAYLEKIEFFLQKDNFEQATTVVAQLCKDLGVNQETKRLSHLGLVDILQQDYFLVDRKAHDLIRRLQELMARDHEINPRNTLMICRKLQSHFNSYNKESPSKKSAQKVIEKLLYRRDIRAFKIICRDINDEQAFDMLKSVISRNYTTLQKLCLGFVGLTDELGIDLLLHLTSFSDCNIYYIGLKGNNLTDHFVKVLCDILENEDKLPLLSWVELRNNNKINWLPKALMELFKTRWEEKTQEGSFVKHSSEEAQVLKAIEAVVDMNYRIRKYAPEQVNKRVVHYCEDSSADTDLVHELKNPTTAQNRH